MQLKLQRIIWIVAGICFLISLVLNIHEGRTSALIYILLSMAALMAFINAYIAHRKITKK